MRWSTVFFTGCVAPLMALSVNAEPTSTDITAHLQKLNSPRFQVREAACRDLLKIGEPALSALRQAHESESAEVRRQVSELIRIIEWEARNRELLTPPQLHLQFEDKPLAQAVEELKQKTGLPLQLDPERVSDPQVLVTVDTGEVPFWEALERFYAAAGLVETSTPPQQQQAQSEQQRQLIQQQQRLVIRSYYGGRSAEPPPIYLISGKPARTPFTDLSGPVRIRALASDTVAALNKRGAGESSFTLEVSPAPSLNCQGILGVRIRRAIDPEGHVLVQSHISDSTQTMNPHMNPWAVPAQGQVIIINGELASPVNMAINPRHLPVTLRTGDRQVSLLKEVEGEIALSVLTGPEALVRVPDITERQDQFFRGEGIAVKINNVEETAEGTITVQLHAEFNQGANNPNMILQQRGIAVFAVNGRIRARSSVPGQPTFALQDADGDSLRLVNTDITSQSISTGLAGEMHISQEMRLTFQRQKNQDGAVELVVSGPRPFVMQVPFRLKNVPLP